jgi:hypothetical protein
MEELMVCIPIACGLDPKDRTAVDAHVWFPRYFGEPTNGHGDFQASVHEHLFLNNSEQIRRMIVPRNGNTADKLLKSTAPWEERVDQLFLTVLNRPPRPEERKRFVAHFTSGGKPEVLMEEAVWALLNCSEFRFNR